MAKANAGSVSFIKKPKRKRPGVIAKTKQSKNKHSKNYKKPYAGQG
jgi:hypothetical protein